MQAMKKLMDLPISGSGCLWARFGYRDSDATMNFSYTDSQTRQSSVGTLVFPHAITFRFWTEPHVPADFPSEAYDAVYEVLNSQWLVELEATEPPSSYKNLWRRRHFAVLLSNCGFFELIADDCEFSTRRARANEQD
jgi:hypothetical protein